MEKKGIKLFIIFIIIVLLGAVGYLSYDKFIVQKNKTEKTTKYENDIKSLKNEINNLKSSNNSTSINTDSNNNNKTLIGNWDYQETFKINESDCTAVIKLELNEDGTYSYENGATCSGTEYAKGIYSLGNNKIYLHNDECKPVALANECSYPNCKPIIELSYENNIISAPIMSNRKIVNLKHN